jgi:hypothetical protein
MGIQPMAVYPLALKERSFAPIHTEPGQPIEYDLRMLITRSLPIGILDPED